MTTPKRVRRREQKDDRSTLTFSVIAPPAGGQVPQDRERTGVLIDASIAGIGFLTDRPVEPGSMIRFNVVGARQAGVVMWSLNAEHRYRIGVRVIGDRRRSS
jgi:hypothetical protein